MKRIVLCLDGTWNSAYAKGKRDDGSKVIKPSNVLKLARAITAQSDTMPQVVYYDTGVGSLSRFKGLSNFLLRKTDRVLGGVWGAGFESNVEDALTFLLHNYLPGDEVLVFGFSRGAATARALTRVIDWLGGIPAKGDAYFLPVFYRFFIKHKGGKKFDVLKQQLHENRPAEQPLFGAMVPVSIHFIGVWDTVLSLGGRILPVTNRTYYLDQQVAACVVHARQALAIDERRHDFSPAIWRGYDREQQTLKQRWFAGVHSNIGGGYVNDGLANITWRWMLKEIQAAVPDFAVDTGFRGFYRGYIQDELMNSRKWFYRFKDFVLRHDGTRNMVTLLDDSHANAELKIHHKALQRMLSQPARRKADQQGLQHPWLDLYRPHNVISYIGQRDLKTFFQSYIDDIADSDRDAARKSELQQQVQEMIELFTRLQATAVPCNQAEFNTGYILDYLKTYRVSLTEARPLYDAGTPAGLSGWQQAKLSGLKKIMHGLFKKLSRNKQANLFSLIGEVNGEQVDLGRLWAAADFQDFDLRLSDHIENAVSGPLVVYVNDVKGFYWNNRGSFHIEVTER